MVIQYTTTTTLSDVKSRINYAFDTLDTKTVTGYINKSNNILAELLDYSMDMEIIEENE